MGECKRLSRLRGGVNKDEGLQNLKFPTVLLVALGCAMVISWADTPSGPSEPVPVSRLTIQYRGGTFTLLSSTALTKVIPPSDQVPATPLPLSGFWFELQSPRGELLYRRIISDPTTTYTEVPNPETGSAPERVEVPTADAVFSVLIPDIAGTNQLVLFSSPPGPVGKSQPATVVARIPIVSRVK